MGPELYEKIFKHYTKKQWDKYPEELDASVLMRLPCRETTDDRYFGDSHQALPVRGYTRIFENMLLSDPNITIRLNVDFFQAREQGLLPEYDMLVYTGPIDSYFSQQGMPKLEYRSLRFEETYLEPEELSALPVEERKTETTGDGFFQEAMVVNYPSPDVKFTRIVEYKHVPNQPEAVKQGKVAGTLIAKEYSSAEGDPYYPVPNPDNRALYEKYRALAEKEEGVCFVGRLASYKYFNMDQVSATDDQPKRSIRQNDQPAKTINQTTRPLVVTNVHCQPRLPRLQLSTATTAATTTTTYPPVPTPSLPQAILNALEFYDNLKETGKLAPKRRPEDYGEGDGPK